MAQSGKNEQDRRTLVVGSRESLLAVRQSEMVLDYLRQHCPDLNCELLTMKTTGDRILDKRLDEIGGKGLFVKELDLALREGRTDLSVHSLKDLPAEIPDDLPLIGFSDREDPRDVLVLPRGRNLKEDGIDFSKPVGTSSRRRILQAQSLFPRARFESVRGNVLTRLRKLDEGQYSALILAAAGLRRLGLEDRISRFFSVEELIPSAGQGILALQGRRGEDYGCLKGFVSARSAVAAAAERAFVGALDGGCSSPIAAHAEFVPEPEKNVREPETGTTMILHGLYYEEAGGKLIRNRITARVKSVEDGRRAGRDLAEQILAEAAGKRVRQ